MDGLDGWTYVMDSNKIGWMDLQKFGARYIVGSPTNSFRNRQKISKGLSTGIGCRYHIWIMEMGSLYVTFQEELKVRMPLLLLTKQLPEAATGEKPTKRIKRRTLFQ
ncbi:hypothetical protein CEXT_74831 [Caerostris extrusa]|uniref:Uncharacterized protein n=1 Tax=Caerostris extrusa TaxID=172846 RepID=A0AAV4S898_CAEEX|nr:hypothetical protein CEXT_74831 [Caerostris extrusa]